MTRETVKGERLRKEFSFRFIKRQTNTPKGRERESQKGHGMKVSILLDARPRRPKEFGKSSQSISSFIYSIYMHEWFCNVAAHAY